MAQLGWTQRKNINGRIQEVSVHSHIHTKKDMWAEQVFVMIHFNY